jgi:uncharacterized membrane protein/uncharacterized membrane-anchored protein
MPLPQGFREWLAKESQLWHEQGILQPGQRDQILARYPEEASGSGRMAFVLRAFGVLLLGAAVMLVVGHNWSDLGRGERLATVVAGVALLQGIGLWYTFQARRTGSILGHLAGCLMFGAGIALVGQTYNMDAHSPDAVLAWCLGTLPFALALESALLHLATIALASTWILMEMDNRAYSLSPKLIGLRVTFLLLLLPSAIAAYRNRLPVVAGALAWALMANWVSFRGGATAAAFVLPLALSALHPMGSAYGRGFRFIGALGVTVITLIIGALARWPSTNSLGLLRDPLLLSLTLGAAVWALWAGKRDKDPSRTWPAAIALGTLTLGLRHELGLQSEAAEALVKAAANVLTLATAVWLVRTGLSEGRLRPYVYGSLVFLAWLTARYVDIAKDFGMLGTAGFFAAIGVILFILARVWRDQKDDAAAPAEPTFGLPWLERAFTAITARARPVVLIAALAQCLGLVWMAWNHSRPAEIGQRFVLRCRAVDPRDLMRGEYVTLGYEFSNPNPEDTKRLNQEWLQLSGDERRNDIGSYWMLPEDAIVYVPLKVDAKGLANGGPPTLKRPESGPYLKGFAGSRRFGQIRFGIEAFYVKEGTGNIWEKLRDQGLIVAEIGVLPEGRAGLVALRKADASMKDVTPFHRLEQHFYSGKEKWGQRHAIRTQAEFQRFLSPARVAGSTPRLPDFTKEIVVLITEDETDRETRIAVTGVERFGSSLMVRYSVTQGDRTGHKSMPMEAVIVERGDATEVTLLKEPLGEGRSIRLPLR